MQTNTEATRNFNVMRIVLNYMKLYDYWKVLQQRPVIEVKKLSIRLYGHPLRLLSQLNTRTRFKSILKVFN